MFCPHCGTELPDEAVFCGHCGMPIAGSAQAPAMSDGQQVPGGDPAAWPSSVPPAAPPTYNQAAPFDDQKPKKRSRVKLGIIIGVAVVAVIAVVAVAVVMFSGIFGAKKYESAQEIADGVEAFYNPVLAGDLDSDQKNELAGNALGLMHPEVVEAAMEQSNMDRDEAAEALGDSLSEMVSYYTGVVETSEGAVSVTMTVDLGDELGESTIENVNDMLADENIDLTVTEGYFLEGESVMTFNGDYSVYSAGDKLSYEMYLEGLCAVKIDDSWYLLTGVAKVPEGHGSAEDIAQGVQAFYEPLLAGDVDSDQMTSLSSNLLDLMHPAVVNTIMEQEGMGYDEVAETLGDSLGSSMSYYSSALSDYADTFSLSIEVRVGDELSDYNIEDINDTFSSEGVGITVTEGYFLEATLTVTFKEDYMNYSAGDSESQEVSNLGLCVVKVGDWWYLWGGVY